MPVKDYPYRPLDGSLQEIRVLRLRRHGFRGAIRKVLDRGTPKDELLDFQVKTISLLQNPAPQFYAVSYAWGEQQSPAKVILDGHECTIPDSAEAALRGLLEATAIAKMSCSVPIWIDAVCINQADLAEKSQQVADMGNVYSNAHCVLVWLGDDDGTTEAAVRTMKVLADQCLEWTDGEDEVEENDALDWSEKVKLPYWDEKAPSGSTFTAIESLLGCKYFSRLWVLQEMALAKQLAWFRGTHSIDWQELSVAARWTYHVDHMWRTLCFDPYSLYRRLAFLRKVHILQRQGRRIPVQDLDDCFGSMITLCTRDPRDKVYAILGLLDNNAPRSGNRTVSPVLLADYMRPLVEIYAEVTLLAAECSSMPLFAVTEGQRFCLPSDVESSWPSWVPQLHMSEGRPHAPSNLDTRGGTCRLALVDVHPSDPSILQVAGTVFDTIKHFWRPPLDPGENVRAAPLGKEAVCKHFAYLWEETFVANSGLVWTEDTMTAIAVVLFAYTAVNDPGLVVRHFAAFLLEARKHCRGPVDPGLSSLVVSLIDGGGRIQPVIDHLADYGCVYAFFITMNGRFGLCGNFVAEGDDICVLYGADFPFLMRRCGSVWKLRGTCRMATVSNEEFEKAVAENEQQIFDIN